MLGNSKETVSLPAGEVLTLTIPVGTTGRITRLSNSAGEEPYSPTPIAGADLSFGPYTDVRRYKIECDAGSLTFALATYDPSLNASDTEVAAAIALLKSAGIAFSAASAGISLKSGANGRCGTFVCNGITPVDVANASIAATDIILISMKTPGGTIGVSPPTVASITPGVSFSMIGLALDTSTYSYMIIKVV